MRITAPQPNVRHQSQEHALLDQSRLNIKVRSRTSRLPWRGQFSPELIEYFLDAICTDQGVIYDPFCGSGTVLFEGLSRGHDVWGSEVNPAAWHFAQIARLASLPRARIRSVID